METCFKIYIYIKKTQSPGKKTENDAEIPSGFEKAILTPLTCTCEQISLFAWQLQRRFQL